MKYWLNKGVNGFGISRLHHVELKGLFFAIHSFIHSYAKKTQQLEIGWTFEYQIEILESWWAFHEAFFKRFARDSGSLFSACALHNSDHVLLLLQYCVADQKENVPQHCEINTSWFHHLCNQFANFRSSLFALRIQWWRITILGYEIFCFLISWFKFF